MNPDSEVAALSPVDKLFYPMMSIADSFTRHAPSLV
jgi:hypothetical protein